MFLLGIIDALIIFLHSHFDSPPSSLYFLVSCFFFLFSFLLISCLVLSLPVSFFPSTSRFLSSLLFPFRLFSLHSSFLVFSPFLFSSLFPPLLVSCLLVFSLLCSCSIFSFSRSLLPCLPFPLLPGLGLRQVNTIFGPGRGWGERGGRDIGRSATLMYYGDALVMLACRLDGRHTKI